MGERAFDQTDKLLDKVSRQFDPADPTSPFAKQAKALAEQQQALTESMDQHHLALVGKVDELAKAVEVQKAAAAAAAKTASVTPLKGSGFEAEVDAVMEQIAAGLGDEYASTGGFAGAIRSCKKGDGVLTVSGGQARVVVEMHDSLDRRVWNDYLDEAERNREAAASVGIVRSTAQNQGQVIRVLGSRRVVIAFDPASDDPDLLRTVVQLMRTSAIAATSRRDIEGLDTAEENIQSALALVERIDTILQGVGVDPQERRHDREGVQHRAGGGGAPPEPGARCAARDCPGGRRSGVRRLRRGRVRHRRRLILSGPAALVRGRLAHPILPTTGRPHQRQETA